MEVRPGGGGVDVDVGDGFLAQFVGELLSPLSGTGEPHFFAIPTADDDRSSRTDALLG